MDPSRTNSISQSEHLTKVVTHSRTEAHTAERSGKLQRRESKSITNLKKRESALGILVFVLWLGLFTGGITIDTRPARCLISVEGVKALERESAYRQNPCDQYAVVTKTMLLIASGKILLWFLPVNIALICAGAGLLGAVGNRANLSDDAPPRLSQDNSNPYISALLRGFFVYLIMTSGLLLLDVNPFSDPSPAQYIRLAGFLSLFSFVLSYQPSLFREMVVWTYQRIEQAEVSGKLAEKGGINVHHKRDVHESETIEIENARPDSLPQLTSSAETQPFATSNGIR
jgi:hypothetical protein